MSTDTSTSDQLARSLARRISDPGLRYDAALIDLASALEGDDPRELLELLDDAARPIFGAAGRELREQASAIGHALFHHLRLRVERDDHRALLLGHVLTERRADPLLLAVLGHELARRAGLESTVARGGGQYWTVLCAGDRYLPVGYSHPASDDGVTTLTSCCAHEVSYAALAAITQRGPSDPARLALRVRALLPLRPHSERDEDDG